MKNVLLIGIGGCYNYGCEAIVRGTVNILKKNDPSVTVTYASYNYKDDVKRLAGCDINILSRPKIHRWSLRNVIRKCLSYVGISFLLPYDRVDWLQSFDTVFSIGGDIYTLTPTGKYNASLPEFLCKCKEKGLRYVLWGASVGKFEKTPAALKFFINHLPQIDLIVARETNTIDYLSHLGIVDNVCLAPDPAFFVTEPIGKEIHTSITTIGINLSPMSALYEYGNIETAAPKQAAALVRLMDQMQCTLIFLPHVFGSDPLDNDLFYMKSIARHIPEAYQDRIQIVDTDPEFVGLKFFIKQCDFVIAARMHCAVNAIASSIPALFLSYSEKAKGMAEFVYGTKKTVITLSDFENTQLVVDKLKTWCFKSRIECIRNFDFSKILD